MMCNGKCFLKKKLSESEDKQAEQSPKEVKKLIETSPYLLTRMDGQEQVLLTVSVPGLLTPENYRFINCKEIFHPPPSAFS